MPSLHARLAEAAGRLVRAGIPRDEATIDAHLLARTVLDWDRAVLLARQRDPVPPTLEPAYSALLARRAAREPMAYIRGQQEFWGLAFDVTPDVLIPRPETECIVEEALERAPSGGYRRIIDAGTGSGCIAVALATECAGAEIVATDVSLSALDVARRNAERHQVLSRINFIVCDLLEGAPRDADLIVSNPPYIPEIDARQLQPEVRDHEPATALFAGDDGLGVLRRLLSTAAGHLAPAGTLIVEFGAGQAPAVRALAESSGWRVTHIRQDLQAIPRTAVLRR